MKTEADYKQWLTDLKSKVRSTQIKAALAVNSELIYFYWDLGKSISEKENVYGGKLVERVSKELREEFPEMKGLSVRNLKYCRVFYQFYSGPIGQQLVAQFQGTENQVDTVLQQLVAKLPWGHHILVLTKSKDINEALFYIHQTIEHNWSRNVLDMQIQSGLYRRKGKAVNNFKTTLPEPESDLAQQLLKDPYVFDFMTLGDDAREKDIEKQLLEHITRFLLELGKGFAFVGRQQHLDVGGNDYYLDLLFYHTRLKCYVVIELKNTAFMPEYTGKLNFYLSAVDSLIKASDDNRSIGILLCRGKNSIEAEFALRDVGKPMGISKFLITENLPDDLKSSLPTIEEIENELGGFGKEE